MVDRPHNSDRDKKRSGKRWDASRQQGVFPLIRLAGTQMNLSTQAGYRQAIIHLNQAIAVNPPHHPGVAALLAWRGECYRRLDEDDAALTDFTSAIERCSPDTPEVAIEAYIGRSKCHAGRQQLSETIADLEQAKSMIDRVRDPTKIYKLTGSVCLGLGIGYSCIGKTRRAIQYLTIALPYHQEQRRELTAILLHRGQNWRLLGRLPEAIIDFTEVVARDPRNPDGYAFLGEVFMLAEKFEDAKAPLLNALSLNPKHVDANSYLGQVYLGLGDLDSALRQVEVTLTLNPQQVAAYSCRGKVHMARQEYELAMCDFDKVIRLNPVHPGGYRDRAQYYERLGQAELAAADIAESQRLLAEMRRRANS